FTRRDAYRALRGVSSREIDPILTLLENHGYARPLPMRERDGPGRRASQPVEVNPALLRGGDGSPEPGAVATGQLPPVANAPGSSADHPVNSVSIGEAPGYRVIRQPDHLNLVRQALDRTGTVALDLETTGLDPRRDRVRLLSLHTDAGAFLVDAFAV